MHLPPRTLARRKKARRLSADESDRLLRLARVVAQAEDIFGSSERAGAWLRGTVRALGGAALLICSTPISGRSRWSGSSVASSTACTADPRLADLAALEVFVNLERPDPPGDLVAIAADIPETLAFSRPAAPAIP